MLQRPGCFVMVVFALLVTLAVGVGAINSARGEQAATDAPLDAAQSVSAIGAHTATPRPSETTVPSATPDVLATQAAAMQASADAANAMRAATGTAMIEGTAQARTATAEAWTATAVMDQVTLVAASKTEIMLEVAMLAATVTAWPTSVQQTREAGWATMNAQNTRIVAQATVDAREAEQSEVVDVSLYWATLAIVCGVPVLVLIGLVYLIVALSWRVQGEGGGKAQATVEGTRSIARSRAEPLVVDQARAALIEFVEQCISKSGPGSTTITPQSQFPGDSGWDGYVRDLVSMGLATTKPGNGGGTRIADGMTLADLRDLLRNGSE